MRELITYYSVRPVVAETTEEAILRVEDGDFDETNEICDAVLTKEELLDRLFPDVSTALAAAINVLTNHFPDCDKLAQEEFQYALDEIEKTQPLK